MTSDEAVRKVVQLCRLAVFDCKAKAKKADGKKKAMVMLLGGLDCLHPENFISGR